MAVNLSRNGPALQEAYVRVVTEKSPTDWALFTYEGNSNDIRVAGTGGEYEPKQQYRSEMTRGEVRLTLGHLS
ncbi:drebrin-like, isoform CRA_a [Rattus norvegicus]|uniref:Drebrin-like, isoform CRA_a n=1 Tax=Rattus norvegicus TaxID=10116 RepID=A6IKP4_RAT|nr:drebrin-like, isoform CRA_a [Rattus norvegicus]